MRYLLTVLLAFSILLPCTTMALDQLDVDPQKYVNQSGFIGYVPDRFIVVLKDEVPVNHSKDRRTSLALSEHNGFAELANRHGVVRTKPQFPGTDRITGAQAASAEKLAHHYKVYLSEDNLDEAIAAYKAHPMVERVEKIGIHTVYATPNDTYYDDPPPEFPYDQWHYWDTYGIRANTAWDSESGDPTVLVGDLDIGTKYDHGDLGGSNPPGPNDASTNGNIWVNTGETPGNGQDDDGNGYVDDIIGWDFVEQTDWYSYQCVDADCGGADNDPSDGDGHGTHTAGTIAAITNNGYAVAGVAGGFGDGTFSGGGNGVKVVPCRIGYVLNYLGQDVGVVIMDYVAEAMYYMADLKTSGWNVASINCSFGSTNSGGLGAAADYLIAQDVVICVAAGNSSSSSPDYLGSRGDCLDVAATDQSGNNASFTNYGTWVDIAAPGVEVMSTITDPSDPGGDYIAAMDGTSMACPHVAGVVALLESYNPTLSAIEKINIITDPANTNPYGGSRDLGAGIIDARKCLDAAGQNEDPPVAQFIGSPISGEYPLTVDFTDQSTNTPTSWSWDFGDGVGISTQQNPSYTYDAVGTYTVTLTATNAYGSDDEIKIGYITVTAPPPPTADFTGSPTSGEYPLTVNFTDQSTNTPTSWSWDFGDGVGTSIQQNPSYTYDAVGTYTVTLTATNAYGSDDETKIDYITVTEPGVSTKAYANADVSVVGTLTGNYTNTFAPDNSYEGITEVEYTDHPRKRSSYLEHKWTLDVGSGGPDMMFYVEGYRSANSEGDDFVFAYSTDDVTYVDMVTIASTTEQVYSYTLPTGLTGTVYIQVKDTDLSWDNIVLDAVYVDEMYIEYGGGQPTPPVADFSGTPTSGDYPLTVNFTDQSSNSPTSWSWDFGDGTGTSTQQNPSYTYNSAGTYSVSLTATNAYGSDVETKVDYITVTQPTQDPPVAAFVGSPTSGDYPLTVNFTDQSSNSPTSWSWDFGDGTGTSTQQNPSYTYNSAGTYSVSLTATNAYGSDAETKVDYITVTEPTQDVMHVHDIVVTRKTAGPNCSGRGTIYIFDANQQPVANATVYATATGPVNDNFSGTTLSDGSVFFETGKTKSCSGEWCFEVTNVTHAINTYNSAANDVTKACESGWVYGVSGDLASLKNTDKPTDFGLSQNYPNPFNPVTEISFSLPSESHVKLVVYNIVGQRVTVLANREFVAGNHTVTWNASGVSSGIYLYRLTTSDFTDTKKMVLMK
ncbi:MAG: PKD domain-containing protein [candidate division Zixibacteria bacterium]|nr:PKD domain-containing protein [candidate division Zixibacteria bacterium]